MRSRSGRAPTTSRVGDESFLAKDCPQLAARGFGAAYRYGRRRAIRCGRSRPRLSMPQSRRAALRRRPRESRHHRRMSMWRSSSSLSPGGDPLQPINQGHRYDDDKPMTHQRARWLTTRNSAASMLPIPPEWMTQEITYEACKGHAGYLASMQFLQQRQDLKKFLRSDTGCAFRIPIRCRAWPDVEGVFMYAVVGITGQVGGAVAQASPTRGASAPCFAMRIEDFLGRCAAARWRVPISMTRQA